MSQPLVLGVDGGTTKTIALVATDAGEVVGAARGAGSNMYVNVGATRVMADTVRKAVRAAGARPEHVEVGAFSLSGADWPEDVEDLEGECRTAGLARRVKVVNDAVGALYASRPSGGAVAVVCGTGFAACGRSVDAGLWWGGHWSDAGSCRKRGYLGGRAMAGAAVRAVVDEELGLGPPTLLTEAILSSLGLPTVEALLRLLTARGSPEVVGADLTELLLGCANRNDPVAMEIVTDFGQAMGDFASVAARRVGLEGERFALVLAGGVLRQDCHLLRQSVVVTTRSHAPGAQEVPTALEPACGAVAIGLGMLGIDMETGGALARVAETGPGKEFYVTAGENPRVRTEALELRTCGI